MSIHGKKCFMLLLSWELHLYLCVGKYGQGPWRDDVYFIIMIIDINVVVELFFTNKYREDFAKKF